MTINTQPQAIPALTGGIWPPALRDADGQIIRKGDLVQSPGTKRTYQVLAIKANRRLVLYKHGHPRIRNARPENWRVVDRMPVEEAA